MNCVIMKKDITIFITEDIQYILEERSRERRETAKLRLLDNYCENLFILCTYIIILSDIVSKEELLRIAAKTSLMGNRKLPDEYISNILLKALVENKDKWGLEKFLQEVE